MRYRRSLSSLSKSWSQMKNFLERSRGSTQYEIWWGGIVNRQLSISHRKKSTFSVLSDHDDTANSDNISLSKHLFERYEQCIAVAHAGGGEKAIQRHVEKQKKLLARDRLALFLDDPNDFLELSVMAGLAMEYGNVPKAGMIAGVGRVQGKLCMIVANDATVKGGTVYPITLKKQLRAQEIAEQNRLPTIYIVESGGGFLPLQADIFNPGGRVFCNEAVMTSMGIPQMAIVCGNCTAGGAYIPTMADQTTIVHRKGYIFLGGPPLVQAATGEIVSAEELGGATLHCSVSGCTDYFAENEEEALITGRDMVATLNLQDKLPVHNDWEEPLYSGDHLRALVGKGNTIDIYKVIARLVDGSRFHEFKKQFGPTLVTGFAHIKGYIVGILGSQGDITDNAAEKAAHFVQMCDDRGIPMVFLQNTSKSTSASENPGLDSGNKLRGHAKMMGAVSCALVPKITVIVGNSIGPDSYLMGGRCTSPNFIFCWPNAVVGMTDPKEAVQDLCQLKFEGSEMSEEEKEDYKNKVVEQCMTQSSGFYAASRVWNDGMILPENTRKVLHQCIEISLAYRQPTEMSSSVIRM
ncbi:uncharacterized protein [Argopecten irradians]|uniref:uncharacterized protein n=1 Tax=Argopecten irradians TaxID=31199 RepID=UPI003719CE7E